MGTPHSDLDPITRGGRGFRARVIALCVAVVVLDGFDTQEISFAAPAIARAWHVSPAGFGVIFGIGLFGGLVGAVVSGAVSDRFGRKPALVVTVVLFGVVTLLTPLARDTATLGVLRFVTGLGVGGALPGAIAIAAEHSPQRSRAAMATLTVCGIPLGSVLGSVVAAQLIPRFGWGSIFIVGGVLPLLLAPVLLLFVPEPTRFSTLRAGRSGAARGDAGPVPARVPVWALFTGGRLAGTMLLSAALFLTLLMAFFLVNWLPTVATRAGIGASAAILTVGAWNTGGILGGLALVRLAPRYRPGRAIALAYVLGAFSVAAVGQVARSGGWLLLTTFLAGFLAIGAQMCTVSLLATHYDTALRATGVGWGMGCGRVGGIVGPTLGGWLIGATHSTGPIFAVAGVVCLSCALVVWLFGRLTQAPGDQLAGGSL